MSQIIEEITKRRARRGISEEGIAPEVLDRIFNAAILAPSCNNKQSWRFVAFTEGEAREKAREALLGGNYWAKKAPVLVAVLTSDPYDCQLTDDRKYAQFDTGMAVMNLMLQATREGLYAHPMAGFDPFKLREAFDIGEEMRVITMIAVGKPGPTDHLNEKHLASETSERSRKPLEEVLFWNQWPGQPGDE
jgi:nitroreductase